MSTSKLSESSRPAAWHITSMNPAEAPWPLLLLRNKPRPPPLLLLVLLPSDDALVLPVLVVNDVGMGDPFFCKYVCPQGVLEGAIPLAIANAGIRSALGHLFTWKLVVLIAVVVLSVLFYRPFCKWICPLGAFYALMNRVSLLGIRVDACKCVSCGKCSKVCQMDVDVVRAPNHAECIRCGKCIGACPVDAISYRYGLDVSAEKLPLTADKK